jgi:hypothetical protein
MDKDIERVQILREHRNGGTFCATIEGYKADTGQNICPTARAIAELVVKALNISLVNDEDKFYVVGS